MRRVFGRRATPAPRNTRHQGGDDRPRGAARNPSQDAILGSSRDAMSDAVQGPSPDAVPDAAQGFSSDAVLGSSSGGAVGEAVWDTHRPRRRVLAVVRNLASATRMLDVLPVLHGDPRIGVEFTVSEGSAFGRELPELLRDIDARVVPWRAAVRGGYHLALATSANGGLHRLRPTPVVVMPHGAGHNRLVEAASGSADVASGLAPGQLLHRGRVVPARLVLAHEEQLARLRRSCPPAARVALVAGDPCFDRMTASLPLRDRFRRALGVRAGQRLVVLTSTWNGGSVFGRMPHLLARLTAELPVDEYRVAMALHPNVWDRHGAYQIEGWLAEALNAGLLLVPPRDGWRAALVAADAVVGDHGSVTYYAAALGRPTLLAAFADDEVDPASPMAELGCVLPRFRPSEGLRGQLEKLTVPVDVPNAIGMRGQAAENLRELLYEMLSLEPPANPARLRPVPPPVPRGARAVTALNVQGEVRDGHIRLDRYPAILDDHAPDLLDDPHLVVDEGEADERLLSSADVFVRTEPPEDPEAWGVDVLARYRGAEVAAAALEDGATLVVLRDGTQARFEGADASLCASAAYVLLVSGRPLAGSFTVAAGLREFRVHVSPPPPRNRGSR